MTLQGIIASIATCFCLYVFVRWVSRKAKKNKKAKVVEMDVTEQFYHN